MKSSTRRDRRSRTPATAAVAAGALVLAMLGATGGAVVAVRIGSKQIADNSIRSRDVRDHTLTLKDLDAGAGAPGPGGADDAALAAAWPVLWRRQPRTTVSTSSRVLRRRSS